MNWKASCSDLVKPGISRALLRENFRRFWPIPVLAFLFYFLSGPFMLLMNYANIENERYLIRNMLTDNYAAFLILHVIVSVIAAVTVFRYLQQAGAVTTAHALPFSRSTLFNTNFLSGYLMAAFPIILNGLIFFLIRTPVYTGYYEDDPLPFFAVVEKHVEFTNGAYNVFTAGAILQWVVMALLTILFIYTITVFAGVVTGVSLLHFGFGLWFNFLLPLVWLCLMFYFDLFFFGYSDSGSIAMVPLRLSPILFPLDNQALTVTTGLIYLAATALIALLAKWFYFNRPMERVGDALTFRFMQPLLCYLMAFMSMTLFGLYFDQAFGIAHGAALGIVIGAVLGFIIGRMIVTKTLQIFNKQSLKSFAAFAAIAALLLGSINFDLYGYEKRVPNTNSIKEAYFPVSNVLDNYAPSNIYNIDDPQVLAYVTDIHRELIENRELLESDSSTKSYLALEYTMNSGWTAARRYRLPYEYLYKSEAFRTFYNSPEYRKTLEESFNVIDEITYVQIYDYPMSENYGSADMKIAQEDAVDYGNIMLYPNVYRLDELLEAVKKDTLDLNYSESIMDQPPLLQLEINYRPVGAKLQNKTTNYHVSINARMTHTLDWLREHKICDPMTDLTNTIAGIVVTPYVWEFADETEYALSAEASAETYSVSEIFEFTTAVPIAEYQKNPDGELEIEGSVLNWDGDRVYQYHSLSDTLQPFSLRQIQSELESGILITDPADIRQILSYAESSGNNDRNLFKISLLYKVNDVRLHYRFGQLHLVPGLLAMEECDFTISSKVADYMNNAFK